MPNRWSIESHITYSTYLFIFEYIRSEIIMIILRLLLLSSNQPKREKMAIYTIYEWAQFALLFKRKKRKESEQHITSHQYDKQEQILDKK